MTDYAGTMGLLMTMMLWFDTDLDWYERESLRSGLGIDVQFPHRAYIHDIPNMYTVSIRWVSFDCKSISNIYNYA